MHPLKSFIGGMRGPHGANATWPLARLSIDPTRGVTISLRHRIPQLPGLEPVQYDWPGVDHAERIGGWLPASPGIRPVGRDERSVVFWTWRPDEVLRALSNHGVSITSQRRPPRIWVRP